MRADRHRALEGGRGAQELNCPPLNARTAGASTVHARADAEAREGAAGAPASGGGEEAQGRV